ncbi:Pyridoxal phosphate-dependent transferase, major region, subdomain 2 [Ostreococcus tauri]|uniref:Pyridoxal phosphate-dependent transferase, major region, subdomain 2 n=1 Tax=Ostreococcus tauri TaxID=70448 RepID=A0A090M621_OSTTA|nr:Pyridoxal phosphate-dependent transferase, major region, subdomain 2 [Ostreococcus tauri]CEF99636.1 Pyridoxal phosphate-dependent transferase, major region, subdomain 2 [Ostreococcus tauri]|eukprot:XP_003081986.2 Pyridoxal phosphate-dependent transferase, major region, subdomain 2 [Ostreococcus tauri]
MRSSASTARAGSIGRRTARARGGGRSARARASPGTSKRVRELRDEGAYAVGDAARALERRGRRVVRLEIGQPQFETPENVCEAGVGAIERGETRYSAPAGTAALREAVRGYVARTRGVTYDVDEVIVGPGAKPGLFLPALAIVDEGDEVVYPDPGFPTYAAMVSTAGGTRVPVALTNDGSSFDMDALERAVNEKTKMIVINSPGNPTGGVMPRADVERVAALAKKFNCWVLSDEIYSRLRYDDDGNGASESDDGLEDIFSIAALDGMKERTILVDGFSKTYCMTGWRLGWMCCPKALAERIRLLTVHSVGCVAPFTQAAGVEALTGPQDSVRAMREEYRARRDYLVDALNAIPGIRCPKPQGAFYVFPEFTYDCTAKELADYLLEDAGVALLPGTDFGVRGEKHLRLSYVGSMDDLREAVALMTTSLRRKFPASFDSM